MKNIEKHQSNTYYGYKNKAAFTMLELIFVIVVLGILAALAMSRLDRDLMQEASDSILSDIRYTQHLALRDNKHAFDDPQWQRAFWRIGFENCASSSGFYEYIGTDTNYGGGINDEEAATDPANGKKMIWGGADCSNGGDGDTSDRIFITHKYGITSVDFNGTGTNNDCANAQYIGFDHLGRPHQGFTGSDEPNYNSYLDADCTITFTMYDGDTFAITVETETGHAFIVGQEDS